MRKRIKNKKIKQKYNYILKFLVDYTEVKKEIIIAEEHHNMLKVSNSKNRHDVRDYIDCKSIDLMDKHQCGWYYRDCILPHKKTTLL